MVGFPSYFWIMKAWYHIKRNGPGIVIILSMLFIQDAAVCKTTKGVIVSKITGIGQDSTFVVLPAHIVTRTMPGISSKLKLRIDASRVMDTPRDIY
jgi:hypothetical protein